MPPSIVAMIATDEAGAAVAHEAALQISAMGAQWLTREDVPADVLESERRVATEKTTEELKSKGKPEAVIEKIAPKTVGDLFKEVGGTALSFARVEVGKGDAE